MSDDRARRLAQLRQAYESGILDEDTYRAAVAALEPERDVEASSGGQWGHRPEGQRGGGPTGDRRRP